MARDYWVETGSSGRPRFVKTAGLRRSNTHDGSQSSRSRRVDFLDVTREEYNSLFAEERRLRLDNDRLYRENQNLKLNWRSCDDEARKLQGVMTALETTVGKLEYENGQLRIRLEDRERHDHHRSHHENREREDEMRRMRHKHVRLFNENESLRATIIRLQKDLQDGVGDRARRLGEQVAAWKRKYLKVDDEVERLIHKLDSVQRRNSRLVKMNESLARQDRKLRQEVDYYMSLLRRYGISTE